MSEEMTYLGLRDLVTDNHLVGRPEALIWEVRATARRRGPRVEVGLWNNAAGWRVADVDRLALIRRAPVHQGRSAQVYRALRDGPRGEGAS